MYISLLADILDRKSNNFESTLNIRKTTDEVGCLNTLMNSLNEVISVYFCAKTNECVN